MPIPQLHFRHRKFPEQRRMLALFLLLNALVLIAICIAISKLR